MIYAQDLLEAMATNPTFKHGSPSEETMDLLTLVAGADPNSPDLSEDDDNACWGHYQLSGRMNVLRTWESIGNTETACKLLAAVIKTVKVARHICFIRAIEASSFIAEDYLTNLVEILWEKWKASGGVFFIIIHVFLPLINFLWQPMVKGKGSAAQSSAETSSGPSHVAPAPSFDRSLHAPPAPPPGGSFSALPTPPSDHPSQPSLSRSPRYSPPTSPLEPGVDELLPSPKQARVIVPASSTSQNSNSTSTSTLNVSSSCSN